MSWGTKKSAFYKWHFYTTTFTQYLQCKLVIYKFQILLCASLAKIIFCLLASLFGVLGAQWCSGSLLRGHTSKRVVNRLLDPLIFCLTTFLINQKIQPLSDLIQSRCKIGEASNFKLQTNVLNKLNYAFITRRLVCRFLWNLVFCVGRH